MVCSPHRYQLTGLAYLGTIASYRESPIPKTQYKISYSEQTIQPLGYQRPNLYKEAQLTFSNYLNAKQNGNSYTPERSYIAAYLTQKTTPHTSPQAREHKTLKQHHEYIPHKLKNIDLLVQYVPTAKKISEHQEQHQKKIKQNYRSPFEYQPTSSISNNRNTSPNLNDLLRDELEKEEPERNRPEQPIIIDEQQHNTLSSPKEQSLREKIEEELTRLNRQMVYQT